MAITDAIKKGFGIATKSWGLVAVLFVFNLIWNLISILVIRPGAGMPVGATGPVPAITPEAATATIVFTVLFILASILVQGGALGLVRDFLKEGKAKLGNFVSYGLTYYLRLFGLGFLIMLFVVIVALIAAIIVAATTPLNNIVATVMAVIVAVAIGIGGIYCVVLVLMSPYALVCENIGVIASMKRSFRIVKRAFWKVFFLLVLLLLISMGIGILLGIVTGIATVAMPAQAGQVIIGIVNSVFNGYFGVVMMAAFMTLYLALTATEKTTVEKVF